jgi:hypothetical protein
VYTQPSQPSFLKMTGMAILVIVPLVYLIIALMTGDLLWASSVFEGQPSSIVIHCFGEDVVVEPGSDQFTGLNDLVNQSISGRKRWDSLSLSEATYQDYQNHREMMVLELTYPEGLRIHSQYKYFSNVNVIIIPLVGRHAQTNAVFGRWQENPAAGSFHIRSTTPLVEYLSSQDLCRIP